MINIINKQDCCGCGACVQRCPKQCIIMKEDEEGFLYPQINPDLCIDCGLCERVCPVINQGKPRQPLSVYAAKNPDDEIRLKSSSGGVFTILAEYVIDQGGVVFGVGYNEHWEATHSFTETKEGLAAFRMSKYVQSIVGSTFKQAESFLKKGRLVLYTGTPCQIEGLKKFLRKEYENLLTLDFICHGTPSPGVFRWYLGEEFANIVRKRDKRSSFAVRPIPQIPKADVLASEYGFRIKDIRFRDKKYGWRKYSFDLDLSQLTADGREKSVLLSYTLDKNPFLRGFLNDIYLRPSCYQCPAKQLKSGSDITIGDYWGIQKLEPDFDDDKGVSALLVNTEKGKEIINQIFLEKKKMDYNILCQCNASLIRSPFKRVERDSFYNYSDESFFYKISKYCKVSLIVRIKSKLKAIAKQFTTTHF